MADMTFKEFCRHHDRMCRSTKECAQCGMDEIGEEYQECYEVCMEHPDKAEEIVLKWVQEHPEPQDVADTCAFIDSVPASKFEKTYEQGLEDAWELAVKMLYTWFEGDNEELTKKYSSSYDFISKHTPQEAMQKLQEWEDNNSFKAGDVIEFKDNTKAVVMDVESETTVVVFTENGCAESGIFMSAIRKTGRNVADKLNALLKEIGGK